MNKMIKKTEKFRPDGVVFPWKKRNEDEAEKKNERNIPSLTFKKIDEKTNKILIST